MKLVAVHFALIAPSFGMQIGQNSRSAALINASIQKQGECIPLKNQDSFYSAQLQVGTKPTIVDAVVDTGSNTIVIDQTHESQSMKHSTPPQTRIASYGSGDATMEIVEDTVKFGRTVLENQEIELMEGNNFGFSIEGILPLGPSDKNKWKTPESFSLCFKQGSSGALRLGDGGGSISASDQWEIPLSDISVDGSSTGISGSVVPDSGTTLLIAPSATELSKLFLNICSEWSNCKNANGGKGEDTDDFFASVKEDCGKTMPPISFIFAGGSASIPASSYVVSSKGECTPAFDIDSYFSFWILGMPLFSSNTVQFSGKQVGFTPGCGGCGGDLNQVRSEGLWQLSGPPRWPTRSQRNTKTEFVVGDEDMTNPNVVALVKHLTERGWAVGK